MTTTNFSVLEHFNTEIVNNFSIDCIHSHCTNSAEWYAVFYPQQICKKCNTDIEFICGTHKNYYISNWNVDYPMFRCSVCNCLFAAYSYSQLFSRIDKI